MTCPNVKRLIAGLGCIVVLSACTQTPTQQISQFGTAVEQLTNELDSTITTINKKNINYQLQLIATQSQLGSDLGNCPILLSQGTKNKYSSHGRKESEPAPSCSLVSQATFEDITPIYAENEIKNLFVVRANKALKRYAQSLQRLNDASSSDMIDASVVRLDNSLVGIYTGYETLSGETKYKEGFDSSLALISTAVNTIGRTIAEDRRREALKTIIKEVDPWIGRLTEQMVVAVKKHKFDILTEIYDQKVLESKFHNYNMQMRSNKRSPKISQAMIYQLYEDWKVYSSTSLRRQSVVKSIEAIRKSHAILLSKVGADVFTSAEVARSISDLQDHYKSLTSFHELLASCDGKLKLDKEKYGYTCDVSNKDVTTN